MILHRECPRFRHSRTQAAGGHAAQGGDLAKGSKGGRRTAQPRATVRDDSRRRRGRAFGTAEVARQRHGGPCSAPGVYLCLLLNRIFF
ncbi:TPA: hypothetical protein L6B67_08085 [Pseudomonas aeruginosa]|nr:hypothetical protein [Pseudomonas aeruginosa]